MPWSTSRQPSRCRLPRGRRRQLARRVRVGSRWIACLAEKIDKVELARRIDKWATSQLSSAADWIPSPSTPSAFTAGGKGGFAQQACSRRQEQRQGRSQDHHQDAQHADDHHAAAERNHPAGQEIVPFDSSQRCLTRLATCVNRVA